MENLAREIRALDLPPWVGPAVLGVAFHMFLQLIEIDLIVPWVFGALVAAGAGVLYAKVQLFSEPFAAAAAGLAGSTGVFALAVATSLLVYRALFHRLNRFPGPFAARITRFYTVYLSSKNLQYHLELEKLHKTYGDVVRTGPREISVARASAVQALATARKSTFYQQTDWDHNRVSLPGTRDLEDHRRRRRPWEQALSMKELAKYDANIQSVVDVFIEQLSKPERLGKSLDISEWVSWLSYDLMGMVGYSRDFGNLTSGTEHAAVKSLRDAQYVMGYLKGVPWFINVLLHLPGATGAIGPFVDHCKQLIVDKRKAMETEKDDEPKDVVSWLLKAHNERSPNAARTKEAMDEDSRAMVTGGADTASSTMINALYYLATHPEAQAQLQREVDAAVPDGAFAYAKIKDLPLLEGVINETLRLRPPVLSGNPRVTPAEGLRVDDDLYLPGGVDVVVPQWVVHRDARHFDDPDAFVPERWVAGSGKAGMLKDRRAWFPFQIGTHFCVGKQLAYWEMKSVLARVALAFDVSLAPGEDGKKFHDGILDTFVMSVTSLRLCFNARSATRS